MGTASSLTALGLALGSFGCGFEHGVGAAGDGGADVPPVDVVPATPRWIVAGIASGTGASVAVLPFSGTSIGTACSSTPTSTYEVRDLVGHPSLPYAYGVDTDLRGHALSCGGITTTSLT